MLLCQVTRKETYCFISAKYAPRRCEHHSETFERIHDLRRFLHAFAPDRFATGCERPTTNHIPSVAPAYFLKAHSTAQSALSQIPRVQHLDHGCIASPFDVALYLTGHS